MNGVLILHLSGRRGRRADRRKPAPAIQPFLPIQPFPPILSVSAATPGSVRPPRNSSEAPPPVEMCVTRSAMPAFLMAAIESPPPTIVVPLTSRPRAPPRWCRPRTRRSRRHPSARSRPPSSRRRATPRNALIVAGPMSTPETIADCRVAHVEHFVRGAGVDAIGHDVIDRQLEADAACFAWASIDRASSSLSSSTSDLPDGHAARFEERVGHRAADEQAVDLAQQVLDDFDLVRHLGAAENRDERPLGRLERLAQILAAPAPSAGRRPPAGRWCVMPRPTHARGAPRRTRRSRRRRRATRARPRTPGRSSPPPAWNRRFSSSTTPPPPGACTACDRVAAAASPMQSSANATGRPSSSARRSATGCRLNSRIRLAFRPAQVAREHRRSRPRRARTGSSAATRGSACRRRSRRS